MTEFDRALVPLAGSSCAEAVALLYDQHGGACFALAVRLVNDAALAETLVQQAVLLISRQPGLMQAGDRHIRMWLLDVVYQAAAQRLGRGVGLRLMGDGVRRATGGVECPVTESALRTAVAGLPPELRMVLELGYFDRLDYRQVAAQLELAPATVIARMRAGLQELRRLLDGAG